MLCTEILLTTKKLLLIVKSFRRSGLLDHRPRHQLAAGYSAEGPTQRVRLVLRPRPRRLVRRVPPVSVLRPRPPLPSVLRLLPRPAEACSVEEPQVVLSARLLLRLQPASAALAQLLPRLLALASLGALHRLLRWAVSVGSGPPAPRRLPTCSALPLPPALRVRLEPPPCRTPSHPRRMGTAPP